MIACRFISTNQIESDKEIDWFILRVVIRTFLEKTKVESSQYHTKVTWPAGGDQTENEAYWRFFLNPKHATLSNVWLIESTVVEVINIPWLESQSVMWPFYFWRRFCRLHRACARCCAQINCKRTRWTRRAKNNKRTTNHKSRTWKLLKQRYHRRVSSCCARTGTCNWNWIKPAQW